MSVVLNGVRPSWSRALLYHLPTPPGFKRRDDRITVRKALVPLAVIVVDGWKGGYCLTDAGGVGSSAANSLRVESWNEW